MEDGDKEAWRERSSYRPGQFLHPPLPYSLDCIACCSWRLPRISLLMCVPSFPVYTAFLYNWFISSEWIEAICFMVQAPQDMLITLFPYIQVVLSSSCAASSCTDVTMSPFYRWNNQGKKKQLRSLSCGDLGFTLCLAGSVECGGITQFPESQFNHWQETKN